METGAIVAAAGLGTRLGRGAKALVELNGRTALSRVVELFLGLDEVGRAIDRVVWYAGWCDKLAQVLGAANPVAGPYFNFTVPEPTGVVGILAPEEPARIADGATLGS